MNKRLFWIVTVLLLAGGTFAEAQQPGKIPRIGYLSITDAATDSPRAEAIRRALRELGYIEGQNIAIEYRYAEGKPDRQPALAAELVRLKVDVIVLSGGRRLILAAKKTTKTIPIVMTSSG
ncbi:MAG TPA: ABC transporter substrate binding protein, partial [Candidatus Binatia bacterium]